jgi:hypothetical protein|nr:MAG TPA: Terminase large subunit [Caudoviricetes sp.]
MNEKLVKSLKEEPAKYARLLGFDLLTDLHNEWIKDMVWQQAEDETLLAHRGSYKTTCVSFALALIIVLKPSKTTIFIRKTDTDVIEIAKQTDKILRSDLFSYIVKEIYGVDLEITSNSYQIDTNLNTGTKGTPQLICLGIYTSLTGKHSDYIFTDDIVNVQDRISQAERDRTKLQYQELQNIKNRGGRIFNTCTPWHKQDAISELMPNKKFYDCYSTGLISESKLRDLRESMDPSLFAANYELKHIANDKALFSKPNYCNDETLLYEGVSHIDASYGGADWTAYTIMKKANGKIYALGKTWQKHVDDCLGEIQALQERFKAGTVYNEKNADKGYLAKELQKRGMVPKLYQEKQNKYVKISTYLRREWKNIYWLEETDRDYMNQVLDYTENAEHDDCPDSAASLIRQMEKRTTHRNRISGGL